MGAAKIYMVRHAKAGIITSHVFSKPPTEAQVAPIAAEIERLHGTGGWIKIHEAALLDETNLPEFPDRSQSAGVQPFTVSGTGTVADNA